MIYFHKSGRNTSRDRPTKGGFQARHIVQFSKDYSPGVPTIQTQTTGVEILCTDKHKTIKFDVVPGERPKSTSKSVDRLKGY